MMNIGSISAFCSFISRTICDWIEPSMSIPQVRVESLEFRVERRSLENVFCAASALGESSITERPHSFSLSVTLIISRRAWLVGSSPLPMMPIT